MLSRGLINVFWLCGPSRSRNSSYHAPVPGGELQKWQFSCPTAFRESFPDIGAVHVQRPSLSAFCSAAALTLQTATKQHIRQFMVLLRGELAQRLSWRPDVLSFILNYCVVWGGRYIWRYLVQPAQSRVNFGLTAGCSGPCPVAFWAVSRMKVHWVPVAVFDHCLGNVGISSCNTYSHHLAPGNRTCLGIFLQCEEPPQISVRLQSKKTKPTNHFY